MNHLPKLLSASEIARRLKEVWPPIRGKAARLFLFNGVWNQAPELRDEIAGCARRAHIIVADEFEVTRRDFGKGFPPPFHLITVSPAREAPEWIKTEIAVL